MSAPSPKIHNRKISLRNAIKLGIGIASLIGCILTQGCSTPSSRFAAKAAALKGLSPADRQLVLNRNIRQGLSEDAVFAAWGPPSKTNVDYTAQGPQECWTYDVTYYGDGGGDFGVSHGLVHGKNGDYNDASNFYPAPDPAATLGGTRSNTVPMKRVIFRNGYVVNYETAY
jgi:hypothetical protein